MPSPAALPARTKIAACQVIVCTGCSLRATHQHQPGAEGKALLTTLKKILQPWPQCQVRSTNCLGGCTAAGEANPVRGCCSVAFTAPRRYTYVLNQLHPVKDLWKILHLLTLYSQRASGLIRSSASPHCQLILPHILTRVPASKS